MIKYQDSQKTIQLVWSLHPLLDLMTLPMEKDPDNDYFVAFPYQKEVHSDGGINNGGIDLTKELHRLDEIHEIKEIPWLRRLLIEVNANGGLFMTFGCDFGPRESGYAGYIDFSFRPERRPADRAIIRNLDHIFYQWLSHLYLDDLSEDNPVEFARNSLQWNYSPLAQKDEAIYDKVTLWFGGSVGGCEWLVNHIRHFLVVDYPLLPLSK